MHPYAAADTFIKADPKSRTSSKVESGSALPVPIDRPHCPTEKTGCHGTFSIQLEEKVPDSLL